MKKDRSAIIFYLKFAILLVLVAAWGTELLLNFIHRTQNLDSAQDKNFPDIATEWFWLQLSLNALSTVNCNYFTKINLHK